MKTYTKVSLVASISLAGIVLLFLALASVSVQANAPVTHTVCASGCDHEIIQKAVVAAAAGDTILVADDSFNEVVVITKSLTLMGGYTGLPGDNFYRAFQGKFQQR